MPNKLALSAELWLAVQQQLYRGWGPFVAPFELSAIAAAWTLAIWERDRRPMLHLMAVAALSLSSMLLVFFAFNAPVNAAVSAWHSDTLPADWGAYRLRWEIGHALAWVLAAIAFIALMRASLLDARGQSGALRTMPRTVAPPASPSNAKRARVVRLRARSIPRLVRTRPS
jgi:hypothetical protein